MEKEEEILLLSGLELTFWIQEHWAPLYQYIYIHVWTTI